MRTASVLEEFKDGKATGKALVLYDLCDPAAKHVTLEISDGTHSMRFKLSQDDIEGLRAALRDRLPSWRKEVGETG